MNHIFLLIGTFIAIGIAPAEEAPKTLTVFPDHVSLETKSDFHKLVVLATYEDGATQDVTAKTRFQWQLPDGRFTNYFLTTFGRTDRQSVCSCEVKVESNLSQALHHLNGNTIEEKVATSGIVGQALAAGRSPAEIIEELYIRAFSRKPTEEQVAHLVKVVGTDEARWEEELNDIFWALLNSKEFLFNH